MLYNLGNVYTYTLFCYIYTLLNSLLMFCFTLDKQDTRWTVAVRHWERNYGPTTRGSIQAC